MSKIELNRVIIIQRLINGEITNREAAEALNLSLRQIKRLKKGLLFGEFLKKQALKVPKNIDHLSYIVHVLVYLKELCLFKWILVHILDSRI